MDGAHVTPAGLGVKGANRSRVSPPAHAGRWARPVERPVVDGLAVLPHAQAAQNVVHHARTTLVLSGVRLTVSFFAAHRRSPRIELSAPPSFVFSSLAIRGHPLGGRLLLPTRRPALV